MTAASVVFGFSVNESITVLAALSCLCSAEHWYGMIGATFRGFEIPSDRLVGMTSSNYKDLDALVPDEVTVKLGGTEYILPGDLPLEVYLRVNKASELEEEDEQAALNGVVSAMVDLFAYNYKSKPEYEAIRTKVENTLRNRGVRFNTRLLQNIYGEDIAPEDAEGDAAANPTP